MYIYINIYTYIHTHTHTHIHISSEDVQRRDMKVELIIDWSSQPSDILCSANASGT